MENYFNYFTEIEEHFQRRRGRILLLSTLDWALIETWKEAGIPLAAVLRGIDAAFDRYDQRPSKSKKIKGTNLAWRGWYAFRRGLATNLYRCGMRPEKACLILRNSAEVVRRHYIRLEQEGTKVGAMARLEQAYDQCAANVQ